jgi:sulfur transfer complex TusBCD TusB component (DsrH family)
MKIKREIPENIYNLLMSCKHHTPLFLWLKDGVYVNFGALKGTNITKAYEEDSESVLNLLDDLKSRDIPLKLKLAIEEVEEYLLEK